jgi:hypothetical protein
MAVPGPKSSELLSGPRRRWLGAAAATALLPAFAAAASPRTLRVAPGESLARVLASARAGDTVELLAGEHRAQAGVITQDGLVLRARGGVAQLHADGAHAEGKALLVVRAQGVRVEGIHFHGARVPDRNGAGIRFERGSLTVRDCAFADHEMGLLTSNHAEAELTVQRCRFHDAPVMPAGSGFTHLLYVGRIARLVLEGSRFGNGRHGHLLKSRAAEQHIHGNRFGDDPLHGGGQASYEIDLPNGGSAWLHDNLLVQGPGSGNRTLLAYGAEGEGGAPRPHRLVLERNSFVNLGGARGPALRLFAERLASTVQVQAQNNLLLGELDAPEALADSARGNAVAPLHAAERVAGGWRLRGASHSPGALLD